MVEKRSISLSDCICHIVPIFFTLNSTFKEAYVEFIQEKILTLNHCRTKHSNPLTAQPAAAFLQHRPPVPSWADPSCHVMVAFPGRRPRLTTAASCELRRPSESVASNTRDKWSAPAADGQSKYNQWLNTTVRQPTDWASCPGAAPCPGAGDKRLTALPVLVWETGD